MVEIDGKEERIRKALGQRLLQSWSTTRQQLQATLLPTPEAESRIALPGVLAETHALTDQVPVFLTRATRSICLR